MSTTLPHPAPVRERTNYLNADYGWKSWLFTTDHKRIALLYLFSITAFFLHGRNIRRDDAHQSVDAGGSLFP